MVACGLAAVGVEAKETVGVDVRSKAGVLLEQEYTGHLVVDTAGRIVVATVAFARRSVGGEVDVRSNAGVPE